MSLSQPSASSPLIATDGAAGSVARHGLPAAAAGVGAGLIVVLLMWAGSLGFRTFDAALIGYAVGTIFAAAAIVYRYTLWIMRPPTWRYFKAGWVNFFSWRNFRHYTLLIPVAWWRDIFAQTFIRKRSTRRWVMHLCLFWGVVLSCCITFPLTFGWFRFTFVPPNDYQLWFFGLPLLRFAVEGLLGFTIYHGLDWTAALLIVGLVLAFGRRIQDAGLLTLQRFTFDLMPLVLLFAIAVTGLALTASSTLWQGRFYWFISLTHEVVVVAWLLALPFAKFFHIIERPASIGVTLYQTVNQESSADGESCKRCGRELPSRQFIDDLRGTLTDLGQHYDLGDGQGWLQEYCPTCKRVLRGQAYYQLMGKRFL